MSHAMKSRAVARTDPVCVLYQARHRRVTPAHAGALAQERAEFRDRAVARTVYPCPP